MSPGWYNCVPPCSPLTEILVMPKPCSPELHPGELCTGPCKRAEDETQQGSYFVHLLCSCWCALIETSTLGLLGELIVRKGCAPYAYICALQPKTDAAFASTTISWVLYSKGNTVESIRLAFLGMASRTRARGNHRLQGTLYYCERIALLA